MKNVVYVFSPQSEHAKQIEVGFMLLKKNHNIEIEIKHVPFNQDEYPTIHLVTAHIGGLNIAFDLLDGYLYEKGHKQYEKGIESLEQYLKKVDVYFKRSYDSTINKTIEGGHKIKPLGLNYYMNIPSLKNNVIRYISKIFSFIGIYRGPIVYYQDISLKPQLNKKSLNILFITRLWDPQESLVKERAEQRIEINNLRINLCRKLKREYPLSVCGLMDSPLAREMAPDLILPKYITFRRNYIKIMHKSDICIATTGLHNSIGWRFGEYVAASKIIISEKLHYEVPYGFAPSINYFEFKSVDECIQIIKNIENDSNLADQIKLNNYEYYENYLKPDKLVYNALVQCKISLKKK